MSHDEASRGDFDRRAAGQRQQAQQTAPARAQREAAGQALDEHRMSNGETTWLFEGQRGQMWAVCWQPGRAEDNLRVWPCDRRGRPGRTQMWLHAASYADARATAGRIALLFANPCPADFSDVAGPGSQ